MSSTESDVPFLTDAESDYTEKTEDLEDYSSILKPVRVLPYYLWLALGALLLGCTNAATFYLTSWSWGASLDKTCTAHTSQSWSEWNLVTNMHDLICV